MAAAAARLEARGEGRWMVEGELVFATAPAVLAAGEAAFRDGDHEVSLAAVTRSDSAGLAVLVEWSLQARAAGRRIRYRDLPPALVALVRFGGAGELLGGDA